MRYLATAPRPASWLRAYSAGMAADCQRPATWSSVRPAPRAARSCAQPTRPEWPVHIPVDLVHSFRRKSNIWLKGMRATERGSGKEYRFQHVISEPARQRTFGKSGH